MVFGKDVDTLSIGTQCHVIVSTVPCDSENGTGLPTIHWSVESTAYSYLDEDVDEDVDEDDVVGDERRQFIFGYTSWDAIFS